MGNQKKHKEIYRMNCLIGNRNSKRIWLMKVLQQSLGNPEQGSQDTSKSSHELPMEPRAKVEPGSCKHSVYAHFPKDPNCDICLMTKITRASCRRRAGTVVPRAERFGDLITADHKVLSEESESPNNHRYAVVVQDVAHTVDTIIPVQNKNFLGDPEEPNEVPGADEETKSHLHWQFLGIWQVLRGIILESLYVDTTQIGKNGIAERAVHRVTEGTFAVLLQSGLANEWWAESMEFYIYLRNIQDLLSDGKTPYERRFGMPLNGPVIPFGAMVEYHIFCKRHI